MDSTKRRGLLTKVLSPPVDSKNKAHMMCSMVLYFSLLPAHWSCVLILLTDPALCNWTTAYSPVTIREHWQNLYNMELTMKH